MGILERIKDIEKELERTQKNKATESHRCKLRAQLAKLRTELLEPAPGQSSGGGEGFEVSRTGSARVALIGFPSVGKSTLLSALTGTKSEQADYAFTTLYVYQCVMMFYAYPPATVHAFLVMSCIKEQKFRFLICLELLVSFWSMRTV